jgi:hypothetical protein
VTSAVSDLDRELLDRAAWFPAPHSWRELTVPVLQQLARRHGIEFATALLYDRIVRSPEHGPFIRALAAPDVDPRSQMSSTSSQPAHIRVALIPGACYREYPETGADGRRVIESLRHTGARLDVVPVESFGDPAASARLIVDWFRAADEPSVAITLSKGAAELRLALAHPDAPAVFRNLKAWVSISGSVFGTAMAGWLLRRPLYRLGVRLLCWRHGYSFSVVEAIDRRADGLLAGTFKLPAHLRTVHLVGFPLLRHLRDRRSRIGYCRLASQGPNDAAGSLLGDLSRLAGWIYPLWGVDHYMEPAATVEPILPRLLHFLTDDGLAPKLRDSCPASVPQQEVLVPDAAW